MLLKDRVITKIIVDAVKVLIKKMPSTQHPAHSGLEMGDRKIHQPHLFSTIGSPSSEKVPCKIQYSTQRRGRGTWCSDALSIVYGW